MSKKHWIYIKRGLSEDPKHRAAIGECIWLYMHIIDRADWETGVAYDWKDKEEAADMSMPVETMRRQRQKLEELNYIKCQQKQHTQDIYIYEWKNPRDYSCDVKNPRTPIEGSHGLPPSDFQGSNQGGIQGGNQVQAQVTTPTSSSISKSISDEKPFSNAMWDAQHGREIKLTPEEIAAAENHSVAMRLSEGLRRGQFPETPTAQSVYRWVIEQEKNGQPLGKFIAWAMDGKRAEFSFIYHKDPSLIKRDWLQVFAAKKSKTRGINNI